MRNSLAYTKLEFKAPKKWLMCLIFLCPSLFIWENVSANRGLNPPPRDTHLSVKKSLEKTLVSLAAGFCVLSCVTKITVSSLGLVWGLIFVFRCWVLLKILFGQLSSLPWAFCGTPEIILSIAWQWSSPVSVKPMCTGKIPWMIRVAIANWTSLSQTNI